MVVNYCCKNACSDDGNIPPLDDDGNDGGNWCCYPACDGGDGSVITTPVGECCDFEGNCQPRSFTSLLQAGSLDVLAVVVALPVVLLLAIVGGIVLCVYCCCCKAKKDGKRRTTLGTQARHQQYAADASGIEVKTGI